MPSIHMVLIKIQRPKVIGRPSLGPSTSHIVSHLLVWVGHQLRHPNDFVRLATLIVRMISSTITTPVVLTFGPTLSLCMPPSTKRMELLSLHILTTMTSRRRCPIVTLSILKLSLTSLVLWRWTTVHSLIPVLSIPIKLISVTRLATLNTPQSRSMPTRFNLRRRTRLWTNNHQ